MKKAFLALDYGKKRIGVATGNLDGKIAFPKGVIENKGRDFVLEELRKLCEEGNVDAIVVGLPLNMAGDTENEMVDEVRSFVVFLREELSQDVSFFDERLSTFEAKEMMREIGGAGFRLEKGDKDVFAAQIILQRFFDTYEK